MCGICGIVYAEPNRAVSREVLVRMRDSLIHRGPNGGGVYLDNGVGLGHRRLAILDLSQKARQPMMSRSGRYWITYNGEIYNFQVLRKDLEQLGHDFRSKSDTEVLVQGLEEWGIDELLRRLDGIFAFAAWDKLERRLIAARDQFGVKPLYYCEKPEGFWFGSEMKALWVGGCQRTVDPATLEELLVFRFVAGESTPFSGIKRLLPGHYLVYQLGRLTITRYWTVLDHVGSDLESVRRWEAAFTQAVHDQRVSDVPLGTLLSGGLDSSTITAALARENKGHTLQAFTVSVPPGEGLDEGPFAEKVATRWKCRHHRLRIPASDVLERLRVAQSYHDEPLAHGNDMHIYELSRLARQHVTVLLSGEGADETLGGYSRYQPVRAPWLLRLGHSFMGIPVRAILRPAQKRQLRTLQRILTMGSISDTILFNSVDVLPQDLRDSGYNAKSEFTARRSILEAAKRATREPVRQLMLYDVQTFLCSILNRNDRMTMGASIECRVPFLSVPVVESAMKIPTSALFSGRFGKQVLRNYASELLPKDVLKRPKWGLGIPWFRYFRCDPHCRDFVTNLPLTDLAKALEMSNLAKTIGDFFAGDDRSGPLVYQTFILAVWWEQIVSGNGGVTVNDEQVVYDTY